jgi:cyclopropane fatty-acyl-phospholipid synthase-like methyltransferase
MADTPVDEWIAFIEALWSRDNLKPELILDAGCGTGALTLPLARKGYNMIGIDISDEMLSAARRKSEIAGLDILFSRQDIRDFELYGTVDSIICVCDAVNYLAGDGDLYRFFNLSRNYLNPGGLFVFDVSTEYKYKEVLAENNFCDINENAAYIWENSYDPGTRINEYLVTFFMEDTFGRYERFEELHRLRVHSVSEIKSALKSAGFSEIETYDANGFGSPAYNSERIFFSARK